MTTNAAQDTMIRAATLAEPKPCNLCPDCGIPLTCRTCVDYTNVLSDITVGYMGGNGEQWLLVRNARGQQLIDLLGDRLLLKPTNSATVGARRGGAHRRSPIDADTHTAT